jgi:hypothetical protein
VLREQPFAGGLITVRSGFMEFLGSPNYVGLVEGIAFKHKSPAAVGSGALA